jgi:hypothetical protein
MGRSMKSIANRLLIIRNDSSLHGARVPDGLQCGSFALYSPPHFKYPDSKELSMSLRILWALWLLICAPVGFAQRAIPDDNLAYPVLINLTDCANNVTSIQGTGFFLNSTSATYLVTARHVLFNEAVRLAPDQPRPLQCRKAELLSYPRDPKEKQLNRFSVDLQALNQAGKVRAHPSHDVAVVQVAIVLTTNQPPATAAPATTPKSANSSQLRTIGTVPGVALNQSAPSGILGVGLDTVEKFDQVLTPNDIYVLGYPASIGLQQAPQIDYNSPLLRKGIVAGTNSANKTIVLDCMTFHGNSGGPVLEVIHQGFQIQFRVIGVVSQYVPVAETWVNTTQSYFNMQLYNSGYSIAEPMDPVLELVAQ